MITYNIKINPLKSRTAYSDIVLKFCFLFDGIDFENAIFTLKAKRADGEIVTAASSLPEIVLPNNMYCIPGEVVFEIAASAQTGKYVTIYVLTAFVREGFGDDGISADDRYPVLTTLIDEVNDYKSLFSELLDENGSLKSTAIADKSISAEKLADGAITSDKLADSYAPLDSAGKIPNEYIGEDFITRTETETLIQDALQSLPNASGVSF